MGLRVGIVGASGYSGAIALRIVLGHPRLALEFATSDRNSGECASEFARVPGVRSEVLLVPNARALDEAFHPDVVLLCTSAEVSSELASKWAERGARVIDLSGAFRLETLAEYKEWYGFEHPHPGWLAGAHYGLPELFGTPPEDARVIANPGCYPTATLLALAPLLAANLIEERGIIVDAKSGVSGAGRKATEAYSFVELDADFRAYKLLAHQHTPEIARFLGRARGSNAAVPLTFTLYFFPLSRGLFVTSYARPQAGVTERMLRDALEARYANAPFVRVTDAERVSVHAVAGTNFAYMGVRANADQVVLVSAIDNLVKGAAGQAIQNLNLWFGFGETEGLAGLAPFAA